MYAAENDGSLPDNRPKPENTNSWVEGDMTNPQDATNQLLIVQGGLFPYASAVPAYRCPADPSRVGSTARVRSYSMNGWMGSRCMDTTNREPRYRTFVRDTELAIAGPASLWVQMDEHEGTINDGWFEVTMDDSHPFASFPATRHDRGYCVNFADGHVELYKLRDPSTRLPGSPQADVSPYNTDWRRLKQITTVQ
jgi:prepilin-type processing-associated H-X9-DG protein